MIASICHGESRFVCANGEWPVQAFFRTKNGFSIFTSSEKIGFANQSIGGGVVVSRNGIEAQYATVASIGDEDPFWEKQVS